MEWWVGSRDVVDVVRVLAAVENGIFTLDFMIIQFPVANAEAAFNERVETGQFQGMISTFTPSLLRTMNPSSWGKDTLANLSIHPA
jgi:hypothetical protein